MQIEQFRAAWYNYYINYLFKELPQLEGEQKESDIEKYLPWSKDLPQDMKNYDGEYKELNIEE